MIKDKRWCSCTHQQSAAIQSNVGGGHRSGDHRHHHQSFRQSHQSAHPTNCRRRTPRLRGWLHSHRIGRLLAEHRFRWNTSEPPALPIPLLTFYRSRSSARLRKGPLVGYRGPTGRVHHRHPQGGSGWTGCHRRRSQWGGTSLSGQRGRHVLSGLFTDRARRL